jgi:hypothetical protein
MRKYSAEIMLQGVCTDALRLLHDGDTKGAYKILKNKINEIDKIEDSDYAKIKWT